MGMLSGATVLSAPEAPAEPAIEQTDCRCTVLPSDNQDHARSVEGCP